MGTGAETPGGFARLLRAAPWATGALALALCLPSLDDGLLLDDHLYTRLIEAHLQGREVPGAWFELAGVRNPEGAAGVARRIDAGQLPFWADPELSWAMFRPVAVLTHYLDMWRYPQSPTAMHIHSLLWYAALLSAVYLLYRRLLPGAAVAALALAIYALSSGHIATVAWLATRNAVMVAVFGALTLLLHERARHAAGRRAAVERGLGALCLLLSLWSSEGGVALWGFLLAHASCVDDRRRRARLLSLGPAALVTLGWLVHYRLAGFGARGATAYVDPVTDPEAFAGAVPARLWALCESLFGMPGMQALPLQGRETLAAGVTIATLLTLSLCALRDRYLRFWLLGSLLSLLPLCAAQPGPRLRLLPAIGAAAALSLAMRTLWARADRLELPARAICGVWLSVHVPQQLAVAGDVTSVRVETERQLRALAATLPPHGDGERRVIVLNTPDLVGTLYAMVYSSDDPFTHGQQYALSAEDAEVLLSRPDAGSLRLRPVGGYLHDPGSRAFRARGARFAVGQRFAMGPMTAEVETITDDGRPMSMRFRFGAIDDPALAFVHVARTPEGLRALPVTLPAVGESRLLR